MKPSSFSLSFSSLLAFFFISSFILTKTHGLIRHKKLVVTDPKVIPGRYIVEFSQHNESQPFADHLKAAFHNHVEINEHFDHPLFRGISFNIDDPNYSSFTVSRYDVQLEKMLDQDHISAIYPVNKLSRPDLTMHTFGEDSDYIAEALSPHRLTQVDRVHEELSNMGEGITVGIIDTGIDYFHPALGNGFGKGFKVALGEDLVGNEYDSNDRRPIIKPNPTPLDNCGAESGAEGHGTHVAGIVAGYESNFTGVAPKATLGMWRVFGCKGSTGNDIIIKALLKAYDAGCDIISLSLGNNNGWSEGPHTVVASRIVKKGIPVVIAAGNQGASGAFTVGSPSTGEGVLSVASFDNENKLLNKFHTSGAIEADIAYLSTKEDLPEDGEIVIGDTKVGEGKDACSSETIPDNLEGKYALIQRGDCTFVEKAKNLAKAGAIGVIVYNNVDDEVFGMTANEATIPLFGIGAKDGQELVDAINNSEDDEVFVSFDSKKYPVPLATRNTVSAFSSVGASYELDLRPNLAGVGGNMYSTLPRYLGSYGVMSGTSMATPYVSGAIALYLKSLEGKTRPSPQFIFEHFQHYAYKTTVNNTVSDLDTPLRQGAGLVQVYDTITQKVHLTPGQISFNDTATKRCKTEMITITNRGDETVKYSIKNNVTLSIRPYNLKKSGYTYVQPINYTTDAAYLRFSKKFITLQPGESAKVQVRVYPPHTNPDEHIMYGGYIQFESQDTDTSLDLTVPYFGVVGKQKDLPIFDQPNGFPYLSNKEDGSIIFDKNETLVIHRDSKKYPQQQSAYLFSRFLTPTALIETELLDGRTGKVLGQAFKPFTYNPRNTLNEGEQTQYDKWTGKYFPSSSKSLTSINAPNGVYRLRMKALHVFGNPRIASDYDIWVSPLIHIRP